MKLEDLKNGIDNIKPDPYMETRLAQKVYEAAPKKRSKRKLVVAAISGFLSLAIIITALGFGGFLQNFIPSDPNIDTTEPITENNNDAPEYLPSGGFDGNYEYYYAYDHKLYSLDAYLLKYIRENIDANLDDWLNTLDEEEKNIGYELGSPEYTPWLVRIIEEFNVPKEYFEELNNFFIEMNEKNGWEDLDDTFTQDEIDALYSNDPATITKVFASNYAIIVDDKACSPEWYLNATQKELKQYGVSTSEVEIKTEILLRDSVIEVKEVQ